MSEIESSLNEENLFLKELFNFNRDKAQLAHLKDFIRNSKNDSTYFIDLLEIYSECRPNQQSVSRELVDCIYSCFPDQINEIQQ